jgi:hypothetical protein
MRHATDLDWLLRLDSRRFDCCDTDRCRSPEVPTSIAYQGRLLDEFGEPRTGSVDLTLRIHDAVVGGTLVYRQDLPSVLLADGVFSVQLGPTGEATDSPTDPLTTILAAALMGDAGPTAPVRFIETTVGGEDPLARTQILASAYALRAWSAVSADTATSSSQVGGFPSEWIAQLLTHTLADGSEPPNTDVREGLADPDGDGLANFVDPDNDNDALRDGVTLANGQSRTLADAFTFEPATLPAIAHAVPLGSSTARAAAYDLAVKPARPRSRSAAISNTVWAMRRRL